MPWCCAWQPPTRRAHPGTRPFQPCCVRPTDDSDTSRGGHQVARYITITLDKRRVSCKARLLDDAAPRTCQALWDALPLSAPVFHGKYARNEIYMLVPAFAEHDPG